MILSVRFWVLFTLYSLLLLVENLHDKQGGVDGKSSEGVAGRFASLRRVSSGRVTVERDGGPAVYSVAPPGGQT